MRNIGLLTEEVCTNETAITTAYHNNHPGRNILVSSVFALSGRIGFKCYFFLGQYSHATLKGHGPIQKTVDRCPAAHALLTFLSLAPFHNHFKLLFKFS